MLYTVVVIVTMKNDYLIRELLPFKNTLIKFLAI